MRVLTAHDERLGDDELAEAYAFPPDRTWVRLSFVASLDGAVADPDGHPAGLSSDGDQRLFALLRSLCDVVLVGAGTARAEEYAPVAPDEVDADLRARLGLAPLPPICVVTSRLHVPETLLSGDGARTLVVTSRAAPEHEVEQLRSRADVLVCGEESVDLVQVREELAARGLRRVQAEGGPALSRDLAAAGVLDELCLTLAPTLVAGHGPRLTTGDPLSPPLGLRLAHGLADGDELYLRYVRDDS